LLYPKRETYRNPKIYNFSPKNDKNIEISPKMIWGIVLLIIIVAIIWFFFYSNYFKIKNIETNGTYNNEVKTLIDQFYEKNILLFRPGKIESDMIAKQSSIKNIEIKRGVPDTLKIDINVRTPVIIWKTGEKKYYLDDEGIVFELDSFDEASLNIVEDSQNIDVTPGTKIVTKNFIDFVNNISEKIKKDFEINIKSIKITETTFQIEIEKEDGIRIIFNTLGNPNNQIEALKKILEAKKDDIHEYIDLRIEGRVYYK